MNTYLAINVANKKFQVGSSVQPEVRIKQHLNSKDETPFYHSLRREPSNFYWVIGVDDGLGKNDRSDEQFYLDFYCGSPWCYNLNPHADRPSLESQRRGGSTQGAKNVTDRTGFLSPEWTESDEYLAHQSTAGKIGGIITGYKHLENRTGLFAQTKEQLSENARKVNAQVWESTHDGFRGNAGNVARHNKVNGWDPSDRVKLH